MNAILVCQNSSPSGHDTIIIDGSRSFYSGNQEQRSAILKSSFAQGDWKRCRFPFVNVAVKGVSSQLKIYRNWKNEVLLTSNMLSKDENGRNITYSFFNYTLKNPSNTRQLLEDYCIIAKVKPNPRDLIALEKTLIIVNNKVKILVFIISLIFLFITLLVCI